MPLTLRWRGVTTLPVEFVDDALRPDHLAGRTRAGIARLPARIGREPASLGDLFDLDGDPGDGALILEGDLAHVRRIGAGMASGTLTIRGDAGPMLGLGMTGGTIDLDGSAGPWAGAAMAGGSLRIRGSAGDHLGAALPGARRGMTDGLILVDGAAGRDAGLAMRRGIIAIAGPLGDGPGRSMIAGTILAIGSVGRNVGHGMKRGTIALLGPEPDGRPEPSPTFAAAGRHRFPFLAVFLRHLRGLGFPIADGLEAAECERYNGDRLEGGRGEILVLAPSP